MQLLHIDSSILGAHSVSRELSADVAETQRRLHSGVKVIYRDLAANPLAHFTAAHFAARQQTEVERPEELRPDIAQGDAALEEFLAADIVVIGAPMYNFSLPTQLKAWIDRIAYAGKTFSYSEKGPVGLAGGKKVIIVSSRGGFYGPGTPMAMAEHQEAYLQSVFHFIGVTDFTVIRAEGVSRGADQRTKSIEAARAQIAVLA